MTSFVLTTFSVMTEKQRAKEVIQMTSFERAMYIERGDLNRKSGLDRSLLFRSWLFPSLLFAIDFNSYLAFKKRSRSL
jgi:hypothetical protein